MSQSGGEQRWRPAGSRDSYLLAQVSDAADLEGAGGLRVLHLQVDTGASELGHGRTLQQRRVEVEVTRHGALWKTHGEKTT